jgi:hypothetical protein
MITGGLGLGKISVSHIHASIVVELIDDGPQPHRARHRREFGKKAAVGKEACLLLVYYFAETFFGPSNIIDPMLHYYYTTSRLVHFQSSLWLFNDVLESFFFSRTTFDGF